MCAALDALSSDRSVPLVTVVVPTLAADESLGECLESLRNQSFRDFEIVVVDNSGRNLAQCGACVKVIRNSSNIGFGAAVNRAFHASHAPFLATLNDDAVASPGWLGGLVEAMQSRRDVGMCASQVRLAGDGRLDSA